MKTKRLMVFVLFFVCAFVLSGQAYAEAYIDFGDEAVFEQALNDGEIVNDKIVSFEVMEIHPNSSLGFNLWAGKHLNFVSSSPIETSPKDILTVRVKDVKSSLGSWIITYEVVSDAIQGPETRYYDYEANKTNPLEIIECGFSYSDRPTTYYSFIIYNPNGNKTIRHPTIKMIARDNNGELLGTTEQSLLKIDPYETVAFASTFSNLDVAPATIDFQIETPKESDIIKPKNVIDDPLRAINYSMTKSQLSTKVVGEISNNSGYDFSSVGIVVLFRDANGNLAGGQHNYVRNVLSGQLTPFDVSVDAALAAFDRYEVRIIPWSDAEVSKNTSNQSTQATAAVPATAVATPNVASASAAVTPPPKPTMDAVTPEPSPMVSNNSDNSNINSYTEPLGYESIYNEYAQKIREAVPDLLAEYNAEAANNSNGMFGLAEISNNKVSKLAEISNEGVEKMAAFMMSHGSGNYNEYSEWSQKLYSVYMEESEKITSAYMNSAMSGFDFGYDFGF